MPEGDFHPSDHARSRAHLLAPFGRGDAPLQAHSIKSLPRFETLILHLRK